MTTDLAISVNSQSASSRRQSIKLLIFTIGKLTLSLPILKVKKVVKYNQIQGSGLSHVGLTHLAEGDLTVIDLHRKIFGSSLAPESQAQGYFLITIAIDSEPLGIFVSEPPSLIDVPTNQIRSIPQSYRHADTLAIASHVTVIPQTDNTSQTIFILDLASLI